MAGLVACVVFSYSLSSLADTNSKSGVPMTTSEVRALYSGNSALWPSSKAYFKPTGIVIGLYGNPIIETYSGTWNVSGNRMCMSVKTFNIASKKSDGKTFTDCWAYYTSGSKAYSKRTSNWRPVKEPIEHKTWLQRGDRVTALYKRYAGSL